MSNLNRIALICAGALLFGIGSLGARAQEEMHPDQEVVVYAYDSFASEWGPGPHAVTLFEEQTGLKLRLISVGDAGQVLQRAVLERNDPKADVIIGVDNNALSHALDADILQPYRSPQLEYIPRELHFDESYHLLPFDHGHFAVIYDTSVIADPPSSLEELTESRFQNRLILMDPRTSSPGLGFLFWTIAVYGDDYLNYWERLKPSILTITEGWSSGYGLFTQGEAPMVLSYTTSPPYHVEYEDTLRFQAAHFSDGHYAQIEGIGILKGARNPEGAQAFVDFVLGREFQEVIPLTNWMYPARGDAALPDSFAYALEPDASLLLAPRDIDLHAGGWVDRWVDVMSR